MIVNIKENTSTDSNIVTNFEKDFFCDTEETNIGNFVYLYSAENNFIKVATDNNNINPIIGVVKNVDEMSGSCQVLLLGYFSYLYENLTEEKKIFLGESGEATDVPPLSGYLQFLGYYLGNNQIFINPSYTRVKRS